MSTSQEQNKAIILQVYEEIFGQGKLELIPEIFTEDFIEHVPPTVLGQPTRGPEALKAIINRIRTAFPDLRVNIDDVVIAGDRVAVRSTWSGTHQGAFG